MSVWTGADICSQVPKSKSRLMPVIMELPACLITYRWNVTVSSWSRSFQLMPTTLHILNHRRGVRACVKSPAAQISWNEALCILVPWWQTIERLRLDQQIYGMNRRSSVQVWHSKAKSSLNISSYRKAAPFIPDLLSSDEPYMDWLSDQLLQECTRDCSQLVFIEYECYQSCYQFLF